MKKMLLFTALVLLLSFSCENSMVLKETTDHSNGEITINTFTFTALDRYTDPDELPDETNSPSSRALLVSDQVELYLFNSSGNLVDTVFITSTTSYSGWSVNSGSGYYIEAYIYNTDVSSATPVVYGISDTFSVTSNTNTNVSITCIPYSPTSLAVDMTSINYTLNATGEKWFSTTIPSAPATVSITSLTGSDTGLYVFDDQGSLIGASDSVATTDTVSIDNAGDYYFGVLEYSGGDFYIEVATTQTDDPTGENDTMDSAIEIYESTSYFDYQADSDWFKVWVSSGYPYLDIDCYFTDADGDIDIALYDSTGVILDSSTSVSDNESIDYVVPTDNTYYYIQVFYGNAGNAYELIWDDLTTTLDPGTVSVSIQ